MSPADAASLRDAVFELRRELRMREHLYPEWVANGRLKADEADRRIRRLKVALAQLERDVDGAEQAGRLL